MVRVAFKPLSMGSLVKRTVGNKFTSIAVTAQTPPGPSPQGRQGSLQMAAGPWRTTCPAPPREPAAGPPDEPPSCTESLRPDPPALSGASEWRPQPQASAQGGRSCLHHVPPITSTRRWPVSVRQAWENPCCSRRYLQGLEGLDPHSAQESRGMERQTALCCRFF